MESDQTGIEPASPSNSALVLAIDEALSTLGIRIAKEDEETVEFAFSRRRGKDLEFTISRESARHGFLGIQCICPVWFIKEEALTALLFCNEWNQERKGPRPYLTKADGNGEHLIVLDQYMLVPGNPDVETIAINLDFFIRGCMMFWEKADKEI